MLRDYVTSEMKVHHANWWVAKKRKHSSAETINNEERRRRSMDRKQETRNLHKTKWKRETRSNYKESEFDRFSLIFKICSGEKKYNVFRIFSNNEPSPKISYIKIIIRAVHTINNLDFLDPPIKRNS